MNPIFDLPRADWVALAPEICLTAAGSIILLLEAFAPATRRWLNAVGVAALVGAGYLVVGARTGTYFHGLIESTPTSSAFALAILLAGVLGLAAAQGYLTRERLLSGEYPAMMLWCTAGLLLLVRSVELLTVFVSLELLSVALYGLAAYHRREAVSTEAAIKYFLMGAFVSSFILYGAALVYGETGTTSLPRVAEALAEGRGSAGLVLLGFMLLLCGFGFKLGLVPFHAWAPDVYQGAPSPFVAFLSVAPKAAAAVVMTRLVTLVALAPTAGDWSGFVSILAIASMLVGNLFALAQRDIKRMLAYSGIAHMGYLLIPLASPGPGAWSPILVYLFAYVLMNGGAFALVSMLYAKPGETHAIASLSGWGARFPLAAACLSICMLSLGGIPPTAGFIGKYLIFVHAIQHGDLALALVGILASLVGIVFYLRVIYMLYMREEIAPPAGVELDFGGRAAALLAAAGLLLIGLYPGPLLDWVEAATSGL